MANYIDAFLKLPPEIVLRALTEEVVSLRSHTGVERRIAASLLLTRGEVLARAQDKKGVKPWSPKTLMALKDSIEHWERMREDRACGELPGRGFCALCRRFSGCRFCPVTKKTGMTACGGTPYIVARRAFYKGSLTAWRKAADVEIAFLESLLPEGKKGANHEATKEARAESRA